MTDLPEEKIQAIKNAFVIIDTNQDGKISTKEATELIKTTGLTTVESEAQEYAKELEEEGNANIDLVDFMNFYNSKMKETESEDELEEVFGLFDKDGDGYITKEEFLLVLKNLNEQLTPEEVEDIIRESDIDGDGKVSIAEFRRIMKAK